METEFEFNLRIWGLGVRIDMDDCFDLEIQVGPFYFSWFDYRS